MPLITVTVDPTRTIPCFGGDAAPRAARQFIRKEFSPKVPRIFALNYVNFGMKESVPESGVQVQHADFDVNDVNTPELWIKVQLSEEPPAEPVRKAIREAIYDALVATFRGLGTEPPANFVLDVFWGPTSGRGTVDGETIEW